MLAYLRQSLVSSLVAVATLIALTSAYGAPNRADDLDVRAIALGARVMLGSLSVSVAPIVDPASVCRSAPLLPGDYTPRLADPVVEAAVVVSSGGC